MSKSFEFKSVGKTLREQVMKDPVDENYLIELINTIDIDELNKSDLLLVVFKEKKISEEILLKFINKEGVDLSFQDFSSGKQAIHFAVEIWSYKIVKEFILSDNDTIDLNYFSKKISPPLFRAIWKGRKDIVELLLSDVRVNVNILNKRKENCTYWALNHCSVNQIEIINLIIDRNDLELSSVIFDILSKHIVDIDTVKNLVNHPNFDPNLKNSNKNLLQHIVSINNNNYEKYENFDLMLQLFSQKNIPLYQSDIKSIVDSTYKNICKKYVIDEIINSDDDDNNNNNNV
eukprot:TRINITY_DN4071_c0_g1_i1.p1 TRINITY_DN4071_c0_g1~~TRINITY_DN4071_c0_g1_i1.p1  ORF type:complete len:289 (-),score=50.78 TRINITY_DN4071_c0_g1_i1:7-873(-)